MIRKSKGALLLTVMMLSLPVYAKDNDLAKCSSIKSDLDRLACYDSLSKKRGVAPTTDKVVTPKNSGKWEIFREKNPLDDSETVMVSLTADSGVNRWGRKPTLVAVCRSRKTQVYVDWDTFVNTESSSVTTRIGRGEAKRSTWSVSTNKEATFHPEPIELLKALIGETNLVLQIVPYGSNPIIAIFPIGEIEEALKPLRRVCGW